MKPRQWEKERKGDATHLWTWTLGTQLATYLNAMSHQPLVWTGWYCRPRSISLQMVCSWHSIPGSCSMMRKATGGLSGALQVSGLAPHSLRETMVGKPEGETTR